MIEIFVPPSMKRCCEDRVDHAVENTRSVGRELGRPTAHQSGRGLFGGWWGGDQSSPGKKDLRNEALVGT